MIVTLGMYDLVLITSLVVTRISMMDPANSSISLELKQIVTVEGYDLLKLSCKFLTFCTLTRSSCSEVFCKIGVIIRFGKQENVQVSFLIKVF